MKRVLTIVVILAVVIGGSWAGYQRFAQAKEPQTPNWETLVVSRGTIVSTVSATGNIEPAARVLLSFKGAGRVADVLVQEGQQVKAGDLLASLETAELQLALAQAETGLSISRAQLSRLENSEASESDLAAAQAALASTQAAYQELLKGPSEDELSAARGTVERARLVRDQAQAAYDQVAHMPNVAMLPQSMQLQQATLDLSQAETNYRLAVRGPTEAQKSAARAQVAQAQASLDRLLKGPAAEDLEIARAQVRQAEVALEQAQLALAGAELLAPFDGVISTLNAKAGELTTGALPAVELTDLSGFHITVNVDEIDVGAVAVGQEATISLDALPDQELVGHVSSIAPTSSLNTGVISYRLRIDIDPSDAPLRSGMRATARIIASQASDVLVLPNRLIRLDRSEGKAYVDRLESGVPVRVEVALGMRNEQQSEIVAGLSEGDEIVLVQVGSLDQLRQTFGPQ